jgi:hypothetical protein
VDLSETSTQFHADGFAVLRQYFDPTALSAEVDDALEHGLRPLSNVKPGAGGVEFQSVVMMCERTPLSQIQWVAVRVRGPTCPKRCNGEAPRNTLHHRVLGGVRECRLS